LNFIIRNISNLDLKIKKRKLINKLYFFYLFWTIVRFSFVDQIHNVFYIVPYLRPITFLIDPFIILLLFGILISNKVYPKKFVIVNIIVLIFILLFCLSSLANFDSLNIANYFKFLVGYLRFIPFIYFTVLVYNLNDPSELLNKILNIIIFLFVLQAVVNLAWFLEIFVLNNPKVKILGNPDWGYGLMENTHIFAMCNIILISLGIFSIRYSNKSQIWKGMVYLIIGLIQLVWAESKVNFLTILLSIGIVSFFVHKYFIDIKVLIIGLFTFLFILFLAQKTFSNLSHFQSSKSRGVTYFYNVFSKTLIYNFKIRFMDDLIYAIPQDIDYPLLGAGPGVLASKFALDNPTPLSDKYFVKYDKLNLLNGNSILLTPRTALTAIYGDLGPLSFIMYYSLHIIIFIQILINYRRHKYQGIFQLVAFIWLCFVVNYSFLTVFLDVLYIGFPVFFVWSIGTLLLLHNK
jgi:hypothetical protein